MKHKMLIVLNICIALIAFADANLDYLKNLLAKHNGSAAWVFDSESEYCQKNEGFYTFYDLLSGMPLKQGGAPSLDAGREKIHGGSVPYIDFRNTDYAKKATLLYALPNEKLDIQGSFSLIVTYKKINEFGFHHRGYMAGMWEEGDKSRSYSIYGDLPDFGLQCVTGQVSNTGFASPPICEWATEGVRSVDYEKDESLWHTVALVFTSNPLGDSSIEHQEVCVRGSLENCDKKRLKTCSSYECDPLKTNTCSKIQTFLDGRPSREAYYSYRIPYQGTDFFDGYDGKKTDIRRKALFTVGGTASRHWKGPDHRDIGKFVSDITLFGRSFEEAHSEKVITDDWRDDFIIDSKGEWDKNDFFVKCRFGGYIAKVVLLKKALLKEEVKEFNWEKVFSP